MKLEEEIQQKKFKSEKQKAILNIYYTNCFITSKIESILSEFALTPQQYNILRILRGQKGKVLSVGEIKDRMLDKNSDVSRIIERLRIKNLIERKINRKNRRQMEVKITSYGLDYISRIDVMEKKFDKILLNLSIKDAEHLNTLLDKIRG